MGCRAFPRPNRHRAAGTTLQPNNIDARSALLKLHRQYRELIAAASPERRQHRCKHQNSRSYWEASYAVQTSGTPTMVPRFDPARGRLSPASNAFQHHNGVINGHADKQTQYTAREDNINRTIQMIKSHKKAAMIQTGIPISQLRYPRRLEGIKTGIKCSPASP